MNYTGKDINALCTDGSLAQVQLARTSLVEKKKTIETELGTDTFRDDEWRSRAKDAIRITESQINRLNLRIVALSRTTESRSRQAIVYSGSPKKIAEAIQVRLDNGEAIYGITTVYDSEAEEDVVIGVHGVRG